jgi:di/tricarboxylate transporter
MLSNLNITLPMIVTLFVLAGLLYGLIKDKPADVMFVAAIVLLAAFGVITPEDAFSGFANSAMLQSWGPTATLAAIYLGIMVLNELISNNAAAALSFPFCLESARLLGVNERPLIMAVTLAASYAFASPIGYQTHMMVFGPGGYRFTDFMRVGIPLNILMWIATVILIPFIWPFYLPN